MTLPVLDIRVANPKLPISVYTIERETRFEQKNALNIEKRIKNLGNIFITFENKKYHPFSNRISEIKKLEDNWDNYGGYSPEPTIVNNVDSFLKTLPKKYRDLLEEDSIFPNPHGTVTVEWRKRNYVVSIEFGLKTSSYYSIINNISDSEEELNPIPSSNKLIDAFNKITV